MYKIDKKRSKFILKKEYDNTIYILAKGEGSQMTISQTIATISNLPTDARPQDVILTKAIQSGVDYILSKIENNELYLEKDIICLLNRYVASNDNFDNLGGFRKFGIKIIGSKNKGIDVQDMEFHFFNLKNEYLLEEDTLKELVLCLKLAKAQFFGDGNKRTAQLMMNGLLVQKGYAPFVLNFREAEINKKLIEYYDKNNIRDILKIMLDAQKETMLSYCAKEEIELIEKEYANDLEKIEKM